MEGRTLKRTITHNPEEAAKYVRSVNLLLQSFVTDIHGFDCYKHLDAWETFLHALSQLLSKLDSAYFTKMDTEVILDTIPDKACDAFLACPEEAANRIQQRVSSDKNMFKFCFVLSYIRSESKTTNRIIQLLTTIFTLELLF